MSRDAARVRAGARLIDVVIAPHALVEAQGRLRLNVTYYITKGVRTLCRAVQAHWITRTGAGTCSGLRRSRRLHVQSC